MKAALSLIEIAGYIVCLLTLAGYLSAFDVVFDLCCHFRTQYLCVLLIVLVPVLIRKQRVQAALISLAVIVNAIAICPFYVHRKPVQSAQDSRTLKILDTNFNTRNEDFEALTKLVDEFKPDIICWQEFSPAAEIWIENNHLPAYKFSERKARTDNFGIAIFSKQPLHHIQTKYFTDIPLETLVAETELGEKTVQIINTHTMPPIEDKALHVRNLQLTNLGAFAKESKAPTILCGDLNTTAWSSGFSTLLKSGNLQDSSIGNGIQPSWPVGLGVLQIPIDHVLLSKDFDVLQRRIGPDVHSDHLPVLIELALK